VIVDTHCHLNFNSFIDDLPRVLENARSAGVCRFVVPATNLESSRSIIKLAETFTEIFVAVGVHPNDADGFCNDHLDELRELARHPKVVAIGEIGLDNYHKDVSVDKQLLVFKAQLKMAAEMNLPVLVHNRDADIEILSCIKDWIVYLKEIDSKIVHTPGILHAFSSSIDFANETTSIGFLLGAAGPVTFKNAVDRQTVFQALEPRHIVIETDSPFLTPHPFRGRRNEPAYCGLIVKKLSELWKIAEDKVEEITTNNASRIFQWKELIQNIE
jgi:TatD DNase family protein